MRNVIRIFDIDEIPKNNRRYFRRVECPFCKIIFWTKHKTIGACGSKECLKKAKVEINRQWVTNNLDLVRKYEQKRREKRKMEKIKIKFVKILENETTKNLEPIEKML